MSMGPDQMGPAGMGPMVSPSWLAATADRERTVGALRAGFVEGRLSQDELDERIAQAYAARTYGDLWALTADLPTGVLPYPPGLPYPQGAFAPGFGPQASAAARSANAEADNSWRSGAALLVLAMVIFTLAALVTAIITAHAQPGLLTPVHTILIPNVVHHLPVSGGQG